MKSYTTGRNLYGKWTKSTLTANLSYGDEVANDNYRSICTKKDWPFLERVRTLTTTESQNYVYTPYDCEQVREISVIPTGQTTRFVPKLSPSSAHWDWLNQSTFTSDQTEWYFVRAGQILLWPTPASTNNTVYVTQKTRVIDLSIADYSTGSVVSIANGGTAIVGTGTTWTQSMVGRWIRITESDTANKGDGVWYEIGSYSSATAIGLVKPYAGTAISAGTAAYVIGQMPLLPEAFQDMPWKFAAWSYWSKEDYKRAKFFKGEYEEQLADLNANWSSPTSDMVIDDGEYDKELINPNLTIRL